MVLYRREDMNITALILKPENYESALSVGGSEVTVLASKRDTSGQEFTYQAGKQGLGPPPHSHAWDESFFVTSGSVEISCDGQTEFCTPGTFVFVPGGTVHSFKYGPDGGEMLEITSAGGNAAQMFKEIDAESPSGPPDFEKIVEVMRKNGVTVP